MADQEFNEQTSIGPDGTEPPAPAETEPQSGQSVEEPEGQQQQDHSSFAEGSFNPNDLPPELVPVYKQMQAAYTQKTQTVAQQRKEAENAMAFLQALQSEQDRAAALQELAEYVGYDEYIRAGGFEFEGGEDPTEDPPQPGQSDPRVDELYEWQQGLAAQQAEAQLIQRIESFTNNEFDRLGVADEEIKELILGRATVYELDEYGMPNIQQATQDVQQLLNNQQKRWLDSKKAPRTPLNGQPGTEEIDFSDSEQRIAHLARALEANSD